MPTMLWSHPSPSLSSSYSLLSIKIYNNAPTPACPTIQTYTQITFCLLKLWLFFSTFSSSSTSLLFHRISWGFFPKVNEYLLQMWFQVPTIFSRTTARSYEVSFLSSLSITSSELLKQVNGKAKTLPLDGAYTVSCHTFLKSC